MVNQKRYCFLSTLNLLLMIGQAIEIYTLISNHEFEYRILSSGIQCLDSCLNTYYPLYFEQTSAYTVSVSQFDIDSNDQILFGGSLIDSTASNIQLILGLKQYGKGPILYVQKVQSTNFQISSLTSIKYQSDSRAILMLQIGSASQLGLVLFDPIAETIEAFVAPTDQSSFSLFLNDQILLNTKLKGYLIATAYQNKMALISFSYIQPANNLKIFSLNTQSGYTEGNFQSAQLSSIDVSKIYLLGYYCDSTSNNGLLAIADANDYSNILQALSIDQYSCANPSFNEMRIASASDVNDAVHLFNSIEQQLKLQDLKFITINPSTFDISQKSLILDVKPVDPLKSYLLAERSTTLDFITMNLNVFPPSGSFRQYNFLRLNSQNILSFSRILNGENYIFLSVGSVYQAGRAYSPPFQFSPPAAFLYQSDGFSSGFAQDSTVSPIRTDIILEAPLNAITQRSDSFLTTTLLSKSMQSMDLALSSIDLAGFFTFEFYTDSRYYYTVKQGQKQIQLQALTNCSPATPLTLEMTFASNSSVLDLSGKTAISFSKVNNTILILANSDSYAGEYGFYLKAFQNNLIIAQSTYSIIIQPQCYSVKVTAPSNFIRDLNYQISQDKVKTYKFDPFVPTNPDCSVEYTLVRVTEVPDSRGFLKFDSSQRTFTIQTSNNGDAGEYLLTLESMAVNSQYSVSEQITLTVRNQCYLESLIMNSTIKSTYYYIQDTNTDPILLLSRFIVDRDMEITCPTLTYQIKKGNAIFAASFLNFDSQNEQVSLLSSDPSDSGKFFLKFCASNQFTEVCDSFILYMSEIDCSQTILDPSQTEIEQFTYQIYSASQSIIFKPILFDLQDCGPISYSVTLKDDPLIFSPAVSVTQNGTSSEDLVAYLYVYSEDPDDALRTTTFYESKLCGKIPSGGMTCIEFRYYLQDPCAYAQPYQNEDTTCVLNYYLNQPQTDFIPPGFTNNFTKFCNNNRLQILSIRDKNGNVANRFFTLVVKETNFRIDSTNYDILALSPYYVALKGSIVGYDNERIAYTTLQINVFFDCKYDEIFPFQALQAEIFEA